MLIKFWFNLGFFKFSAKIFLLLGCIGIYSNLTFSIKKIRSLKFKIFSNGNSHIISKENKNLFKNNLPSTKQSFKVLLCIFILSNKSIII